MHVHNWFEKLWKIVLCAQSPTGSDKKFCWMFCLVLRNSLALKSLFLWSVIFRNDMYLLHIFFNFSNMVSNTVSNVVLKRVLNTVLDMICIWFWTWFWKWDQVGIVVVFRLNMTVSILPVFFKARFRFYSKVFFHSGECFKIQ